MTQRVPDDVIATFARQQHDWMGRVLKGSLNHIEVSKAIQSIINRGQMFNPRSLFKTCTGLWVSDSFTSRILPHVDPMPYRGHEGVTSSQLARNMYDKEIIDEMLGGMEEVRSHAFTLDQIAEMIGSQPNGEDGMLLNNGYANIFYVLVNGGLFVVCVDWISGYRLGYVVAWHLDGYGHWNAGNRVFRNTTLAI